MSWATEQAFYGNVESGLTKREYAAIAMLADALRYRDECNALEFTCDDAHLDQYATIAFRLADALERNE